MKGFRFYADLPGTLKQPESADNRFSDPKPVLPISSSIKRIREYAEKGEHLNCIALMLGREHQCPDFTQEVLSAYFGHANSDTSWGSINRDYLMDCRRISEQLARKLHPRLFARLDRED